MTVTQGLGFAVMLALSVFLGSSRVKPSRAQELLSKASPYSGSRGLIAWHQSGTVENPTQDLLNGVIFDDIVPLSGDLDRFFRWTGEVWSAGPFRAQVEVWVGGGAGKRVVRSNLAWSHPGGGWAPMAGTFYLDRDDPRRVIVRVRSYHNGADAKARNFSVSAVDVTELTPSVIAYDEDEQTLEGSELGDVLATVTLTLADSMSIQVAGSLEVQPINEGPIWVRLESHFGAILEEVELPAGLHNLSDLSVSPMIREDYPAGSQGWSLRIIAPGGVVVRRVFLGAIHADW